MLGKVSLVECANNLAQQETYKCVREREKKNKSYYQFWGIKFASTPNSCELLTQEFFYINMCPVWGTLHY